MGMAASKSWDLLMRAQARLENQSKPEIIGDYTEITSIVQTGNIDRIVVALDERRGKFPSTSCSRVGWEVSKSMTASPLRNILRELSVESLHPSCLIFSDGFKSSSTSKILKRIIDVSVSSFASCLFLSGLILELPLNSILRVHFLSTGKVGEGGKTFRLLKFRSMQMNAEANGPNGQRPTTTGLQGLEESFGSWD